MVHYLYNKCYCAGPIFVPGTATPIQAGQAAAEQPAAGRRGRRRRTCPSPLHHTQPTVPQSSSSGASVSCPVPSPAASLRPPVPAPAAASAGTQSVWTSRHRGGGDPLVTASQSDGGNSSRQNPGTNRGAGFLFWGTGGAQHGGTNGDAGPFWGTGIQHGWTNSIGTRDKYAAVGWRDFHDRVT